MSLGRGVRVHRRLELSFTSTGTKRMAYAFSPYLRSTFRRHETTTFPKARRSGWRPYMELVAL